MTSKLPTSVGVSRLLPETYANASFAVSVILLFKRESGISIGHALSHSPQPMHLPLRWKARTTFQEKLPRECGLDSIHLGIVLSVMHL